MGPGENDFRTIRHFDLPYEAHELTFSCYRRQRFLARDRTREYLVEAIVQAQAKHPFHLWAYVFMPEHVHILVWPPQEGLKVESFLKCVKQSVGRRAIQYLRRHNPEGLPLLSTGEKRVPYRFWQDGPGFDRNVLSRTTLHHMVDYIHNNPIRRGLCACAEDWKWSSAADWAGLGPGPLRLDKDSYPAT
jgi:putative transposase